jgi:hypothetical protein
LENYELKTMYTAQFLCSLLPSPGNKVAVMGLLLYILAAPVAFSAAPVRVRIMAVAAMRCILMYVDGN